MSRQAFLRPESKTRIKQAVEAVEQVSAAEVVVAVRPWSGRYGFVDSIVGAALALAGLLFMLFSPDLVFPLWQIAAGTAGLFVAGAFFSAFVSRFRFALVPRGQVDANVERAAKALFYDLGVSKTRDRSGILVYVSLLEQRCHVVPDVGLLERVTRTEWERATAPVAAAIRTSGVGPAGVEALAAAIAGLAPLLRAQLPVRPDDVNELPDVVEV